ncbi:MAG: hypothetical protein HPY82_22345 [Gammaproteobacteria bacterium]|nr:hypothetical protein [Gammaproteobacteria bacterium]
MKKYINYLSVCLVCFSGAAFADMWAEGVPVSIQKSDYADKHLIYIKFDKPLAEKNGCNNDTGVVVKDTNESSKVALTFAITALTAGKKFRCYVVSNECSPITGSATTYPVCSYYPTISN